MAEQAPTVDQIADDERLDDVFARFLAAIDTGPSHLVSRLWREFEVALTAHMDDEEQRVTPKLAAIRLRDALAILQEHRYLRARLNEIGAAVTAGSVRAADARSLRDELRAHAHHEENIFQRLLADGNDPV
jgi:hypothetical protein